jgi:hypothetical protein
MPSETPSSFFAFFVEDVGGWWSFKGIHHDREEVLRLLEKFKHAKHCRSIVVLELPSGRKAYEWSSDALNI